MALQKTLPHRSGATATYWKLIGIHLDALNSVGRLALAGYVTEEARQANKPPLDVREFSVPTERFMEIAASPVPEGAVSTFDVIATAGYNYIKTFTRPAPNPDFDPTQPASETNPQQIMVPGDFHDAEDV